MVNLIKGRELEERLNAKGYAFTGEWWNRKILDQCLDEVVLEIEPLNDGMVSVIMTHEKCVYAENYAIVVCKVVNGEEVLHITTDIGEIIEVAL